MTEDTRVPLTTGNKMIGWLQVDPETLEITGKFLGAEYAQFVREGLGHGMLEFSFMARAGTPAIAELWMKRFHEFLDREEPKTERWNYWETVDGKYYKQSGNAGTHTPIEISKEEFMEYWALGSMTE
jgi:hypothetical protein